MQESPVPESKEAFSQAYILFVIVSTINVCDRLDLGSWQLFLVGGHPWSGGSGSFPSPRHRQEPPRPSLHSSAVWVLLELAPLLGQARGGGSHGFWPWPGGELLLTTGITEKGLKS